MAREESKLRLQAIGKFSQLSSALVRADYGSRWREFCILTDETTCHFASQGSGAQIDIVPMSRSYSGILCQFT